MASQIGKVATRASPRRNHRNWIESFVELTSASNSPEIYRKWVAITTIGATLQRRVHLLIQGEPLYCNLYTILVGPPGVGKTRAIRFGTKLLASLPDLCLSPDAITREKFLEVLSTSTRMTVSSDGLMASQTAYACYLDELSTFIRAQDLDFMTVLTGLFDCPKVWSYQTLSRGNTRIENLHLTLCGGITPKSIQRNWGEGAIGMGFTARLNMIYSEDWKPIDLFGAKAEIDFSSLEEDLKRIYDLAGRMSVTQEAAKMLQEWVSEGMHPIPSDTRFAEYNPRRSIHWLKLCMAYAVAETDDLIICPEHVESAKRTLLEAEAVLPLCFEHMGQNPLLHAIQSVHTWMKIEHGVSKQPIPEFRVRRKLLADVPPQYVDAAIKELVSSGMATETFSPKGKLYVPVNIKRVD